jgi:hypothetical protein
MSGGLVQMVNYGNQDLTLTGKPEITFFKSIYRRYTNFGKKTMELAFDNPVNFGTLSSIVIPKNTADLLSKLTLKIKLPKIDLKELNAKYLKKTNKNNTNDYITYYNYLKTFIDKLKNIVNVFFKNNDTTGTISYINDLKIFIQKYINNSSYIQFFSTVSFFFNQEIITNENIVNTQTYTNSSLFKIENKILTYIYQDFQENDFSYELFKNAIIENMKILDELNDYVYKISINLINGTEYIKAGWIQKIAIYILKNIELKIGSNTINKFSNDYINNYGDLHYTNKELYDTMIGNNSNEINNLSIMKNEEILYLPLPFWFNNNYGLALPLISLQYATLHLNMSFYKLSDCIFFDIPVNLQEFKAEILNDILTKTIQIFKSELQVSVLAEYIFLDSLERKKFAQHGHEYLITQVQEINFEDVSETNNTFNLDYFHCCKEILWMAKPYRYSNNIFDQNKPSQYFIDLETKKNTKEQEYDNYLNILYNPNKLFNLNEYMNGLSIVNSNSIDINKENTLFFKGNYDVLKISPFQKTTLMINGYNWTNFNYEFYNYLQPYAYYNSTPQLGLNVYSLSLFPTELSQPSGTVNFSRIPLFSMKVDTFVNKQNIDNNFNNSNYNLNNYKLTTQVVGYNILRFVGGYAGLAYTYGNY